MLDSDVAMLYHYETSKVNQAVKRNKVRLSQSNFIRKVIDGYANEKVSK